MIKFKDIKIIAEIGLAHDGSYALAASYIHKAKKQEQIVLSFKLI